MEIKQPKLMRIDQHKFQYENDYGEKSEIFYAAQEYKYGFARVKLTKEGNPKNRDLLGRLSSLKTASGVYFYKFLKGEILFSQLPAQFFVDRRFCQGVKYALLDKLAEEIRITTENGQHVDIRMIKKQKDQIIDMCEEKRKLGIEFTKAKTKSSDEEIEKFN